MTVQTTYGIYHDAGLEGGLFDLANKQVTSHSAEGAAGIDFGRAVSRGTDKEKQVVLGGDNTFLGISIREVAREGVLDTGVTKYKEKETVGVLRQGKVWVLVASGCTAGDPANYADATGVIDSGVAGAGETDIAGATFETTVAAGGLAVLRLS